MVLTSGNNVLLFSIMIIDSLLILLFLVINLKTKADINLYFEENLTQIRHIKKILS